jgi:hypothetical protein
VDDSDFEADDVAPKVAPATPERRADEAIAVAIEFAEVKLSMTEMIYHMDVECHRIEGEQRARILAGTIVEPTAEQIARVARHMAVMKFLKSCHERPNEASAHFAKIARNRNAE